MAIQKISWIIFAWIFIGILLFGCVEKEKLAENLTGVKRPVIPEEKPLEKTTFRSGETVKACNTSVTVNAIKAKSYSFWTENQTGGYSIVAPPIKYLF